MKPRSARSIGGLLLFVAALLLLPQSAAAIPAFARKYEFSCRTCHAPAYPELNAFGRRFQESGFQLPEGAERPYREKSSIASATLGERMGLLRVVPIALRAQGAVEIPLDFGGARNPVDFMLLDNLYLLGAGSIYRDISFRAALSVAPRPAFHHGSLSVHNLFFGPGYLNIRFGQILLFDFIRPEHRQITRLGNPGAVARFGANPTTLDTSHLGIDAWGRLFRRHLFWHLAVVQGAQGLDGLKDLDGWKDLFGELQLTLRDEQTLGLLGYYGRTQITDSSRATTVRFTDPLFVVGGHLNLRYWRLGLFAQFLYHRHDNPAGDEVRKELFAFRADLWAEISSKLFAQVRFDELASRDPTLAARLLGVQLTHLGLLNFKQSVELIVDLRDVKRSSLFLLWDVAL